MSGWIILATLSAGAVVAVVGAWWGGREWRAGDDDGEQLAAWWEQTGAEMRAGLAADIAEGRADR